MTVSTPYWLPSDELILASASRVRSQLLTAAGLSHRVVPSAVDEREFEKRLRGKGPEEIALTLSQAKAIAISERHSGYVVLGCDQILSLNGELLHKPQNLQKAREQLLRLRGKCHELNSAATLARDGAIIFQTIEVARISIRQFSDEFLDKYLASLGDQILLSVGCYQVEGEGIQLFERIEGDIFTIMGLPLMPLLAFMREAEMVRN